MFSWWNSTISKIALVDGKITYSVLINGEEHVKQAGQTVAGPFKQTDTWRAPIISLFEYNGKVACLVGNGENRRVEFGDQTIPWDGNSDEFIKQYKR